MFLIAALLFCRFSLKDKSKINKKFIASDNGSSPTSEITSSRKVSFNGHKAEMRSNVPIIKVMNKDERKLKFESSQIKTWSVREVAQFIRSIGLVEHALHFEEQVRFYYRFLLIIISLIFFYILSWKIRAVQSQTIVRTKCRM